MDNETKQLILKLLHKYDEEIGGEFHTNLLRIFNAGSDFGYKTALEYEK